MTKEKLIVQAEGLSMEAALTAAREVVRIGMVSTNNRGKQYCYAATLTLHQAGGEELLQVEAFTIANRKSQRIIVRPAQESC